MNSALSAIIGFVERLNALIRDEITIDNASFDRAEKIIEGIDLSKEVKKEGGLKGYVIKKTFEIGGSLYKTYIPFLEEVNDLIFTLAPPADNLTDPKVDEALMSDVRKKILEGGVSKFEATDLINQRLREWVKQVNKNEELSKKEKVIKLVTFARVLNGFDISFSESFKERTKIMMYVALKELFEKSKTTVVQICFYTESMLDGEALEKDKIVKTKFSNDEHINTQIFEILRDMGVDVGTQTIKNQVLEKVFPNTKIKFEGHDKGHSEITNIQHNSSEGGSVSGQYANALVRQREVEIRERKEKERILAEKKQKEEAKKVEEEHQKLIEKNKYKYQREAEQREKEAKLKAEMLEGVFDAIKNNKREKPYWMTKEDPPRLRVGDTFKVEDRYQVWSDVISETYSGDGLGKLAEDLKDCRGLKRIEIYVSVAFINTSRKHLDSLYRLMYDLTHKKLKPLGVDVEFKFMGEDIHRKPGNEVKEPLGTFLSLK